MTRRSVALWIFGVGLVGLSACWSVLGIEDQYTVADGSGDGGETAGSAGVGGSQTGGSAGEGGSATGGSAGSGTEGGLGGTAGSGGSEAGAIDSGSDAQSSGGLVSNGGFDEPGIGCGPNWLGYNATLSRSDMARTGPYACAVCSSMGSHIYTTSQVAIVDAGPTLAGQAYVRLAPANGADGGSDAGVNDAAADADSAAVITASFLIKGTLADGGAHSCNNGGPIAAIHADWTEIHASCAADGFVAVGVNISFKNLSNNSCVLIDDVSVVTQ